LTILIAACPAIWAAEEVGEEEVIRNGDLWI
jgi:hypothetical protein